MKKFLVIGLLLLATTAQAVETITFTVPDGTKTRAINSLAINGNYQENIIDINTKNYVPNPETKAQFAKRLMVLYLKENIKAAERKAAAIAAAEAAANDVDALDITVQ